MSSASTIRVKVLFFAAARELAGTGETIMEISSSDDEALTTAALRRRLAETFPLLADQVADITLALNQEYLEPGVEMPLNDNDEVALIPPISGG